jgi:hypothetical protein
MKAQPAGQLQGASGQKQDGAHRAEPQDVLDDQSSNHGR